MNFLIRFLPLSNYIAHPVYIVAREFFLTATINSLYDIIFVCKTFIKLTSRKLHL